MNELIDPTAFKWVLTVLTGGLAVAWIPYDTRNLIVARKADRSDPVVRDKLFGYVMGIVISAIGFWGCLRFHDVV